MIIEYIGVKEINGSLIVLDGVKNASFEETVTLRLEDGSERSGRVVQMEGERVVIQVFEGTHGLSLDNTQTRLKGRPVEMPLSPELLGRIFDGAGRPPTAWESCFRWFAGISTAPPSIRCPGCIPGTLSRPAFPPSIA